jgi:hypothetical protein
LLHLSTIGLRMWLIKDSIQSRAHSWYVLVLQHFVIPLVAHQLLVHAVILLFLTEVVVLVSVLAERVFLLGTRHAILDPFDELAIGSTEVGWIAAHGRREFAPEPIALGELVLIGCVFVVLAAVGDFAALAPGDLDFRGDAEVTDRVVLMAGERTPKAQQPLIVAFQAFIVALVIALQGHLLLNGLEIALLVAR